MGTQDGLAKSESRNPWGEWQGFDLWQWGWEQREEKSVKGNRAGRMGGGGRGVMAKLALEAEK